MDYDGNTLALSGPGSWKFTSQHTAINPNERTPNRQITVLVKHLLIQLCFSKVVTVHIYKEIDSHTPRLGS